MFPKWVMRSLPQFIALFLAALAVLVARYVYAVDALGGVSHAFSAVRAVLPFARLHLALRRQAASEAVSSSSRHAPS